MHIITVAPIKRGIPVDELSYFTGKDIPTGALVTVPLRGRQTPALVIRSVPAENAKAEIKQAKFTLKKLDRIHAKHFFRKEFIDACATTARYFAATTGAVIHSTFPNALILSKKVSMGSAPTPSAERPKRHGERYIFQAEESERRATYKSHIREVFARNASCYFILPSIQDIEHTYAGLEKGIQEYTFILHGGLTKKELERRWEKITTMNHPVLIIGTPLFLALPRYDIESIILERESANAYALQGRPFIDLRFFAEAFAEAIGADLIVGDLFLRTETLYRKEQGEFEALQRPKYRFSSTAKQEIIDMRTSGEQPATGKIAICSARLVDILEEVRAKGSHCFILGVRRGFAPMTVCGDCGTVVACERCSAPMVLHKKDPSTPSETRSSGQSSPPAPALPPKDDGIPRIFLCHRCGFERDSDLLCAHCGGWRLTPLGIGITQAEEAIKRGFPNAQVFRIDRDVIKDHAGARALVDKFYQTPGSILIGTEMAIPYLTEPLAAVAVLSVNSLLTIPDFRMGERVFRLLLILREKAREHFVIQTRDPNGPLFALATEGNVGEFLRTELDARHRLGYPPFSTLLKFTFEGKKQDGAAAMNEIERTFGSYHPVSFPSFIARVKGKYRTNALIKVPKKDWPNQELSELIRMLPPEVEIRVNPESVI
ncbi:MAG: hypothetical protein A2942_03185 [Candidatus Lloydbacteria bacterium RIFCSPLOWO2_01_FULL_50_20]|uniref:Primosomal protein N' 3' DNA-binding domain-containing protein n=1 Tax=Candidatus Lloydbacteria bacterium RIFCSPLOWO2_01_FULL_50_20 TaxID=1798665 RepID=A0A1G2DD85_9BACT|nr:MAG: hypothetical protein A3C13_01525 [Candidatus Lloydbacteria bacterium RIFCSPHIGHO2_02_FULL_50_11]OGZ11595.1 MAG: hypothetical protein A2942_03185 [Candidatus Lloydbacteria bacterium RIFCSPLOWO2_01_FULL_50_20]